MESLTPLITDPSAWAALLTLIVMEVVLGIDNLIFISIVTNRLPEDQRSRGRRIGIGLALVLRLALLGTVAFIVLLTEPLFIVFGHGFSWKDLILIGGGVFLLWKATKEIHHTVDPEPTPNLFDRRAGTLGLGAAVGQILMLDVIFSVDSIITAVGMTAHMPIMAIAVVVAVTAMALAADPLGDFIHRNPTVVMLALGFLLMIGATLIAEGFGVHVAKGYIYAAMAFSAFVEGLNIAARRRFKAREIASGAPQGNGPSPRE